MRVPNRRQIARIGLISADSLSNPQSEIRNPQSNKVAGSEDPVGIEVNLELDPTELRGFSEGIPDAAR